MQEFITEHIFPHLGAFVSAILTGIAGFFFGKKKQNAEVETIEVQNDSLEIDNMAKLLEMYKKTLDDLGDRYEGKFKDVTAAYEQKIKLLEDEINLHKRIITQLREENTMLRKRLKEQSPEKKEDNEKN